MKVATDIGGTFTDLVAIDENGKPHSVPGIILETEAEKAEWEAGEKRRRLRAQRKKEGF